jgi:hypothetical protein
MVLRMHTNINISLLTLFVEDVSLQHLDQEIFYFYTSYMNI